MLSAGDIFAGYTVVRSLGAGGMGEVYLVEHPRLPRQDALKILGPDLSGNDDYRTRFIREADLAAGLWHPDIVRVNDRGEEDGQLWIAMDFIDGCDAAHLLRRYPAGLPIDDVTAIVAAVADALDYAHSQGLLHRDVKPANILLTEPDPNGQRRILLGDFGIARTLGETSGLTATGMTVGTVAYTAPEQLIGDDLDGRADQYALAATAYHLLTGTQLFPHSTPVATISHHLNAAPPPVSELRPEAAALDSALARALSKNPADRYPRCADFAHELTASAAGLTEPAPAAPTVQASRPSPKPSPRPSLTPAPPPRPPISTAPATGPMDKARPPWLIPAAASAGVSAIAVVAAVTLIPSTPSRDPSPPSTTTITRTAAPPPSASSAPPPAATSPTRPPPDTPAESSGIALPASNGSVVVETVTGKTSCQIQLERVVCEAAFIIPTPNSANMVVLSPDGNWQWTAGNKGNSPRRILSYNTTYYALGWTIFPTREGTSFTNDLTGRGMTISVEGVKPY